jgi:hypothetical protein
LPNRHHLELVREIEHGGADRLRLRPEPPQWADRVFVR